MVLTSYKRCNRLPPVGSNSWFLTDLQPLKRFFPDAAAAVVAVDLANEADDTLHRWQ